MSSFEGVTRMFGFKLADKTDSALKVLCLGAHCDDLEIGCGGTILNLLQSHRHVSVDWVVFSSNPQRAEEAFESANIFLRGAADKRIAIKDFKDGFFPYIGAEIKEYFEQIKRMSSPDLIFTHYRNDLHQDHRLIAELTWNTFRNHVILEYEIPKYDGDLGAPNLFVHLSEATCRKKAQSIVETFRTQRDKHWFTEETFLALLRLRGIESAAPGGYAEAFHCRKVMVDLLPVMAFRPSGETP